MQHWERGLPRVAPSQTRALMAPQPVGVVTGPPQSPAAPSALPSNGVVNKVGPPLLLYSHWHLCCTFPGCCKIALACDSILVLSFSLHCSSINRLVPQGTGASATIEAAAIVGTPSTSKDAALQPLTAVGSIDAPEQDGVSKLSQPQPLSSSKLSRAQPSTAAPPSRSAPAELPQRQGHMQGLVCF